MTFCMWKEESKLRRQKKMRTSLTGLCAPPSNPSPTSHPERSPDLRQGLSLPCRKYLDDSPWDVNEVKSARPAPPCRGWAASFLQFHPTQWRKHPDPSVLTSFPQKLCRCFLHSSLFPKFFTSLVPFYSSCLSLNTSFYPAKGPAHWSCQWQYHLYFLHCSYHNAVTLLVFLLCMCPINRHSIKAGTVSGWFSFAAQ